MRAHLLLILLLLPFVLAAPQRYFLPGENPSGILVRCSGKTYDVYVLQSGGAVTLALVFENDTPILDRQTYMDVLRTFLTYRALHDVAGSLTFYTPSTASNISSLASNIRDKLYELDVARSMMEKEENLADLVGEVDTLMAEANSAADALQCTADALASASQALTNFLRSPYCGYAPDLTPFSFFQEAYKKASGYYAHSVEIRTLVAKREAPPETLATVLRLLAPPFSRDQLDRLKDAATSEKELLRFSVDEELIRKLFTSAQKRVAYAELRTVLDAPVGEYPDLESAVKFILAYPDAWADQANVQKLRVAYNQLRDYLAEEDYEAAKGKAEDVRKLVEQILQAGEKREEGLPGWLLPALLLIGVALLLLWWRGKREEDMDLGSDADFDTL